MQRRYSSHTSGHMIPAAIIPTAMPLAKAAFCAHCGFKSQWAISLTCVSGASTFRDALRTPPANGQNQGAARPPPKPNPPPARPLARWLAAIAV